MISIEEIFRRCRYRQYKPLTALHYMNRDYKLQKVLWMDITYEFKVKMFDGHFYIPVDTGHVLRVRGRDDI